MWLDKISTQQILKLRDRFGIKCFIETGCAEGNNAIFYAQYFKEVHSCEIDKELLLRAKRRVQCLKRRNVFLHLKPSPEFIQDYRIEYERKRRIDTLLFFLDAHSPSNWPILDELKALRGFKNCCIVIHDFKVPGLGYISYEGQDLDFNYIKKDILKVNKAFHFYHNDRAGCDIWTMEEAREDKIPGLRFDEDVKARLEYTWSTEQRTYRGILYAVPEPLDGFHLIKMED